MSLNTADPEDPGANSVLIERTIDPAVRRAGETFPGNLDSIPVEQMCETAEKSHVLTRRSASISPSDVNALAILDEFGAHLRQGPA